eukprot:1135196-Rhodomonas_salina.3
MPPAQSLPRWPQGAALRHFALGLGWRMAEVRGEGGARGAGGGRAKWTWGTVLRLGMQVVLDLKHFMQEAKDPEDIEVVMLLAALLLTSCASSSNDCSRDPNAPTTRRTRME